MSHSADDLWHKRLVLTNMTIQKEMIGSSRIGMRRNEKPAKQRCQICLQKKQTKVKSTWKLIWKSANLTIHADIYGPMNVSPYGGNRYFPKLTLAHQRYTMVQMLNNQSDIDEHCHNFINWIERNTDLNVARFHFDNVNKSLS